MSFCCHTSENQENPYDLRPWQAARTVTWSANRNAFIWLCPVPASGFREWLHKAIQVCLTVFKKKKGMISGWWLYSSRFAREPPIMRRLSLQSDSFLTLTLPSIWNWLNGTTWSFSMTPQSILFALQQTEAFYFQLASLISEFLRAAELFISRIIPPTVTAKHNR